LLLETEATVGVLAACCRKGLRVAVAIGNGNVATDINGTRGSVCFGRYANALPPR
jgi:hypothetical protein